MSRMVRPLVALILIALLVVPAAAAFAHDQLTGSSPAPDETLDAAPDAIVLTYSGDIADLGAQVVVTGTDGQAVQEGDPRVAGPEVVQDLQDDLPAGDYAVVWRVTSSDGHPISGEFGFTVEASAGDAGAPEEETAEASVPVTTEEETADESTQAAAVEEPADDVTAEPEASAGEGGMPVWAWVVIAVGVVGLVALLVRTWIRGRS